jgi:hypothetical protein
MNLASYQAAPPRAQGVAVGYEEYKLFEDEFGIRHWRYRMAGVLLVCGQTRTGLDVAEDTCPTCMTCMYILAKEERI